MIAIVDYGVGNLFSLAGSFAEIGEAAVVTGDPDVIRSCDHVVLDTGKLSELALDDYAAVVSVFDNLFGHCDVFLVGKA